MTVDPIRLSSSFKISKLVSPTGAQDEELVTVGMADIISVNVAASGG